MPGIFQEILQFLAGNIAINKDENRKSSFMKVEALNINDAAKRRHRLRHVIVLSFFQILLELLKYIYTMSEEETEVKKIEWEETKEEESGGTLKADCEKLKYDGQYHERMIPWADLRQLSSDNVDDITKKYANALNNDDIVLVKEFVDPENLKKLREAADAIVKIRVRKTKVDSSITFSSGTGFLIKCPPIFWKDGIFTNFAVMTNFHVLKQVH